jgi:hypothetical protein
MGVTKATLAIAAAWAVIAMTVIAAPKTVTVDAISVGKANAQIVRTAAAVSTEHALEGK